MPFVARGAMETEWVTASEIGDWAYCRRAWWYARRGEAHDAAPRPATGTAEHAAVARQIARLARQRAFGGWLMVAAIALATLLVALLLVLR